MVAFLGRERVRLLGLVLTMSNFIFEITVGRLLDRQFRFELEKYCSRKELDLELVESRGWIEIDYQVTIRGDADKIFRARRDLTIWLKELVVA